MYETRKEREREGKSRRIKTRRTLPCLFISSHKTNKHRTVSLLPRNPRGFEVPGRMDLGSGMLLRPSRQQRAHETTKQPFSTLSTLLLTLLICKRCSATTCILFLLTLLFTWRSSTFLRKRPFASTCICDCSITTSSLPFFFCFFFCFFFYFFYSLATTSHRFPTCTQISPNMTYAPTLPFARGNGTRVTRFHMFASRPRRRRMPRRTGMHVGELESATPGIRGEGERDVCQKLFLPRSMIAGET